MVRQETGPGRNEPRPVVLSVAFPYAPIGPNAVGGAEVVCSAMEAAMDALGFASVAVAHEGSAPKGRLYGTAIPSGTITDELRSEVERAHQANIDRAFAEHRVGLVHMHGLDFDRYRVPAHVPVLVTLHLPPGWYPESVWTLPANYQLVCVSESQRRTCPGALQDCVRVVENGVALPERAVRAEGRYALMLARICPEKNLHVGLDAARLAGMPALLGGEVFAYEAHERYFSEEIVPRLTGTGVMHEAHGGAGENLSSARFLGAVTGEEKQRLLSRAACLLLPSLAPETSSLVAMEALAAGTPVIAMAVGAVPGIVEEGRTGFLIEPGEGATERMAAAIGRLPELDRAECRGVAKERFGVDRMVEAYGRLYLSLALRESSWDELERKVEPRGESGPTRPGGVDVETLTSTAELEALGPAWERLWGRDAGTTPFQHPAWLLPWWRQFGPDDVLQAVGARQRGTGELLGFLPLYTYAPGGTKKRQLLLMGAGTTDYLDGVWGEKLDGLADLMLSGVMAERERWEEVRLSQLREGSPLLSAGRRTSLPLVFAESCSVIDVGGELPAKIRANVNRYRRRAEAAGVVRREVAETAGKGRRSFEALVRMHGERWAERGQTGVLQDARVLAHHRESVPRLLEAGLLRMFRLTLSGETMGVLYALADGPQARERRLYLYLIGFERRFAAFSPGTLLLHEAWQYAREHGFAQLDLLRGGESYKQLWGARVEPTLAISLG